MSNKPHLFHDVHTKHLIAYPTTQTNNAHKKNNTQDIIEFFVSSSTKEKKEIKEQKKLKVASKCKEERKSSFLLLYDFMLFITLTKTLTKTLLKTETFGANMFGTCISFHDSHVL